jgi:hypothetical protein
MNRLMSLWCAIRGHHKMARTLVCYDVPLDAGTQMSLTWHYNCLTCSHAYETTRIYPAIQKAAS